MAMLPESMVRVMVFLLLFTMNTSVTLTILFGNIAIKFGATLSLLATSDALSYRAWPPQPPFQEQSKNFIGNIAYKVFGCFLMLG